MPVIVCAAVDANKRLRVSERYTLAELFGAAEKCDWAKLPDEIVQVWLKVKPKGGFRTVCEFKIVYRTMHQALRRIIELTFVPKPFQYEAKGEGYRGVQAAVRAAKAAIKVGNIWYATLDIVESISSATLFSVSNSGRGRSGPRAAWRRIGRHWRGPCLAAPRPDL